MNVGELRKLLEGVPDDLEVVVTGSDHRYSYTSRGSGVKKAEIPKGSTIREEKRKGEDPAIHYEKHPTTGTEVVTVFWIDDGRY